MATNNMLDIAFAKEQGVRFFPITHRKAIVGLATNTLVLSESIDVDVDISTEGEPITINPLVQDAINKINTRCTNIEAALRNKANSGTDGVATSAHKLQTARRITLTGSVTGYVDFNGTSNVTINTSTNHTHNYAGSSSAGGVANSAVKLNTARNIKISGAVTGNANFDGTANININTSLTAHNHSASNITAGTLSGAVYHNQAAANSIGSAQLRNIYAGTGAVSSLTTGTIYLQYS